MDEYIAKEALLLINSLYTGLLVMAYYDILRLFRRLIKHNNFFVGAEDFIFFIIACSRPPEPTTKIFILHLKINGGISAFL